MYLLRIMIGEMQVIDVNLKGTFLVTQTAASLMKEQKLAGSIVNIASIVGRTGNIGQVGNFSKKHFILNLNEKHIQGKLYGKQG